MFFELVIYICMYIFASGWLKFYSEIFLNVISHRIGRAVIKTMKLAIQHIWAIVAVKTM